jgi:hypothetical protein
MHENKPKKNTPKPQSPGRSRKKREKREPVPQSLNSGNAQFEVEDNTD